MHEVDSQNRNWTEATERRHSEASSGVQSDICVIQVQRATSPQQTLHTVQTFTGSFVDTIPRGAYPSSQRGSEETVTMVMQRPVGHADVESGAPFTHDAEIRVVAVPDVVVLRAPTTTSLKGTASPQSPAKSDSLALRHGSGEGFADKSMTQTGFRRIKLPWLAHAPPSLRNVATIRALHVPGAYHEDFAADTAMNNLTRGVMAPEIVVGAPDLPHRADDSATQSPVRKHSTTQRRPFQPVPLSAWPAQGLHSPVLLSGDPDTLSERSENPLISLMNQARERQYSESSLHTHHSSADSGLRRSRSEMAPNPRSSPIVLSTTEDLQNSVAGLEALMQVAVTLAKAAAKGDQAYLVPGILDQATETLRESSIIQQRYETSLSSVRGEPLAAPPRSSFSSSKSSTRSSSSASTACISSDDDSVITPGISLMPPPLMLRDRQFLQDRKKSGQDGSLAIEMEAVPNSSPGAFNLRSTTTTVPRAVQDEVDPRDPLALSTTAGLPDVQTIPSTRYVPPDRIVAFDFAYAEPLEAPQSHIGGSSNAVMRKRTRAQTLRSQSMSAAPRLPVPFQEQPEGRHRGFSINETISVSPDAEVQEHDPHSPMGLERMNTHQIRRLENWGKDKYDEKDYMTADTLKGRSHLTLRDDQKFSLHHNYKRQPIARNWTYWRKRFTAAVVCSNTALVGIIIGTYVSSFLLHQGSI